MMTSWYRTLSTILDILEESLLVSGGTLSQRVECWINWPPFSETAVPNRLALKEIFVFWNISWELRCPISKKSSSVQARTWRPDNMQLPEPITYHRICMYASPSFYGSTDQMIILNIYSNDIVWRILVRILYHTRGIVLIRTRTRTRKWFISLRVHITL